MARIRTIKPEFFTDADLGDLTPLHRLFFAGLWCWADRDGRLEDKPRELKVKCLPYDKCDPDDLLEALHEKGLIIRYGAAGRRLIAIPGFVDHQRFHKDEKPAGYPPPPEMPQRDGAGAAMASPRPKVSPPTEAMSVSGREVSTPDPCLVSVVGRTDDLTTDNGATADFAADGDGGPVLGDPVSDVFEHWKTVCRHPKAKLDTARKKAVVGALKAGHSVAECKQAIDGCAVTPHNQGQNDRGEKFDDLGLILRDAAHIERFIGNARDPPKPPANLRDIRKAPVRAEDIPKSAFAETGLVDSKEAFGEF